MRGDWLGARDRVAWDRVGRIVSPVYWFRVAYRAADAALFRGWWWSQTTLRNWIEDNIGE